MTEQERQETKAKLIEYGFWGADEPGNPAGSIHDAGSLNDRLQAKLAEDVYLVSEKTSAYSPNRQVLIFHAHQTYKLVTAPDYIEAICLAALALPEFLREHPECAADQK